MHMSLHELRMRSRDRRFSESLFKETLLCILQALDFLHREGNVVHTDIKATNIMLRIDDESILEDFEKAEQQSPSPEKVVGKNRTIYTSRRTGLIQPEIYRAPEVLFDMGWGHSADIWNLGVMVSRYTTDEIWSLTSRRRGIFSKGDLYSVRLMKTRNTRRPTT